MTMIEEVKSGNEAEAELAVFRGDKARLDWLEAHPRLASIVIDGKSVECYLYGVSGATGLNLREIIDCAMASKDQ